MQQTGEGERNGPSFVQSLNSLTGNVQLIAGQNVAITSDAEARTIMLGVTALRSVPTINIVRQIGEIPAGMINFTVAISCFPAGSKVVSGGFSLGNSGARVNQFRRQYGVPVVAGETRERHGASARMRLPATSFAVCRPSVVTPIPAASPGEPTRPL